MEKIILSLAVLFPVILGALEITGCRHENGKTQITWKNAPDGFVMVYRYSEKITAQNIFFATRQRFNAELNRAEIITRAGGKNYYMLTVCDRFGKEIRDFAIQSGPVDETAAGKLAPIDFRVSSGSDGTFLVWEPLPLEYRGMIREIRLIDRQGNVISTAASSAVSFQLPPAKSGGDREYTVVAAGVDGRDSAIKGFFRYGDFPDFMIRQESSAVKNSAVSLETRFPVTGRKNRITFRISNCGGKAGSATVLLPDGTEKKITLEPGTSVEIPAFWQPAKRGRHQLDLKIICAEDRQQDNNNLQLTIHAADKTLYFLWYGAASELEFATCGTDAPEHWRRIGGRQLKICVAHKDAAYFQAFFDKKDAPDGLQYDELGGTIEPQEYLAALREFRKKHPDVFIALWHIGANLKPEIVEAVKDGTIDLVMPERYHTWDAPMEESLKKDIAMLRKMGVLHKTIIGLGTHRNYAGYGNAEQHAEYLEKQIALIRKLAPESPGMAFYNDAALPGVKEKVDGFCKKYFLEERNEK